METNDKIYPARFNVITESRKASLRNCSQYTCLFGVFPFGRRTIMVVPDKAKLHGCCDCYFESVCRAAGSPQMKCISDVRPDKTNVHYVLWHEEPTIEEKRVKLQENPMTNDPEDSLVLDGCDDLGDLLCGVIR